MAKLVSIGAIKFIVVLDESTLVHFFVVIIIVVIISFRLHPIFIFHKICLVGFQNQV